MNKFRVWDGEKMWYPKRYQYDDGIGGYKECVLSLYGGVKVFHHDLSNPYGDHMDTSENAIPMFATGGKAKDKNGNAENLYDGDIVKPEDGPELMLVCWNEDKASFGLRYLAFTDGDCIHYGGGYILPLPLMTAEGWVLVGNKYENPALVQEVCK